MRKPEAVAPVAVRQLMEAWLPPPPLYGALFRLRELPLSPLQLEVPSKDCLNCRSYPESFCFDLVKFYHRLGSAHLIGPSVERTAEGSEPGGNKRLLSKRTTFMNRIQANSSDVQ